MQKDETISMCHETQKALPINMLTITFPSLSPRKWTSSKKFTLLELSGWPTPFFSIDTGTVDSLFDAGTADGAIVEGSQLMRGTVKVYS